MSLRLEPVHHYEREGKHVLGRLASDDSLGLESGWHVKQPWILKYALLGDGRSTVTPTK